MKEMDYWAEYDAIHNAKSKAKREINARIARFTGKSTTKKNKKVKKGDWKWSFGGRRPEENRLCDGRELLGSLDKGSRPVWVEMEG